MTISLRVYVFFLMNPSNDFDFRKCNETFYSRAPQKKEKKEMWFGTSHRNKLFLHLGKWEMGKHYLLQHQALLPRSPLNHRYNETMHICLKLL